MLPQFSVQNQHDKVIFWGFYSQLLLNFKKKDPVFPISNVLKTGDPNIWFKNVDIGYYSLDMGHWNEIKLGLENRGIHHWINLSFDFKRHLKFSSISADMYSDHTIGLDVNKSKSWTQTRHEIFSVVSYEIL